MKLSEKQIRFIDYYIQSGNATEAAIKAGYSRKTAFNTGCRNLKKSYIKTAIDKRLEELASARIADATEVMEYLTSVMRGESQSEVAMPTGIGIDKVKKTPDEKERTKAAELIGKRYGIFSEKVDLNIIDTTWFKEDDDEETS